MMSLYNIDRYFNNIYLLLKTIYENKKYINMEEYMDILRAELTQYDLYFIYYYSIKYKKGKEKENKRCKNLKNLIENTGLFYNLHNHLDRFSLTDHYKISAFKQA